MFDRNKKYIFDGGMGQALLDKGLKPEGTLWSATALIYENFHQLVVDTHLDFINAVPIDLYLLVQSSYEFGYSYLKCDSIKRL